MYEFEASVALLFWVVVYALYITRNKSSPQAPLLAGIIFLAAMLAALFLGEAKAAMSFSLPALLFIATSVSAGFAAKKQKGEAVGPTALVFAFSLLVVFVQLHPSTDEQLYEYALRWNDMDSCKEITSESLRSKCFFFVGKSLGDVEECYLLLDVDARVACNYGATLAVACESLKLQSNRDRCIFEVAQSSGEGFVCGLIESEEIKKECVEEVGGREWS